MSVAVPLRGSWVAEALMPSTSQGLAVPDEPSAVSMITLSQPVLFGPALQPHQSSMAVETLPDCLPTRVRIR